MTITRPLPTLLTLLALALAVTAPTAGAQSNPFSPPAPLVAPEAATPAPAPDPDADDDGLSSLQQALIFVGGFGLLAGITAAIVMDARRRRPITEDDLRPARETQGDPEHRRAQNRKRKGKQKTQRAARKHNRPKRK